MIGFYHGIQKKGMLPDFRRFSQNIVLSHQSACEPRELLYMVGTFGTESAVR